MKKQKKKSVAFNLDEVETNNLKPFSTKTEESSQIKQDEAIIVS